VDALYCQFFGEFNGVPSVAPFNSFGWAIINWAVFWLMANKLVDIGADRIQLVKWLFVTAMGSFIFRTLIVITLSDVDFVLTSLKYLIKLAMLSVGYGYLVNYCWRRYSSDTINSPEQKVISTDGALEKKLVLDENPKILADDICWVRACGNYVEMFTKTGKTIQRQPLSVIARQAGSDGLMQVHRSFLVNRLVMDKLLPKENGAADLVLKSGEKIPVSKRYLPEVRDTLTSAMKGTSYEK